MTFQELFECRASSAGALDSRFTLAGSRAHYAPDRTFHTEHIKLEVRLDIPRKTLTGICTTTLRAVADGTKSMVFDAIDFNLQSVRVDARAAKYSYDKKKLTVRFPANIRLGQRVKVEVRYRVVRPKLGLYFIGPDRSYSRKPVQVWTQGEDEYARFWFPCHDAPQDRTTTELIAIVPRGFTAVSNGKLFRRSRRGQSVLFHWKQDIPHSTYLVTLAVGKFSEIRDKWGNVPVLYYCTPGREEDARRAFGKTPKMIDFFSRKIGVRYPYPKYAQVAVDDFIYGGMENTSATTQTALTLHDERAHLDFSSDPLVAHELAHQWFGDLVTCKDWSHAWLNESFATYFEALFQEFDKGPDEFAHELVQNLQAYFDEDKERYRRPIVTKVYKQPSDLFDRHLYEKGSLILHMLRNLLGEKDFWRSIRIYVTDNRGKGVETRDLILAIQKATGKNLEKFFDQWVYRAGHPEYKVRAWWDAPRREMKVRVVQTQATNEETTFGFPITFAFHFTRGEERRFTESVEKKSHLFTFKLAAEPDLVLFDPDHVVLKKVDFPKSEAMWIRQLNVDRHAIGRMDAARALGQSGGPTATKALREALLKEKYWAVQGAIIHALGHIRTPEAVDGLRLALQTVHHPKARRTLMATLADVRERDISNRLKAICAQEKSYFVENEAVRAVAQSGDLSFLPAIEKRLKEESWNDVTRNGALEALVALRPPQAVALCKKHTAYGYPFPSRLTAVRCLAQLGSGRADVQKHLIALTRDRFVLVQLAAVRALGRIGDERALPALKKLTGDLDGRLLRAAEESIQKIQKGIDLSDRGKGRH